jgi:hypothetical protein
VVVGRRAEDDEGGLPAVDRDAEHVPVRWSDWALVAAALWFAAISRLDGAVGRGRVDEPSWALFAIAAAILGILGLRRRHTANGPRGARGGLGDMLWRAVDLFHTAVAGLCCFVVLSLAAWAVLGR